MWHRSASFILDKRENDDVLSSESRRMSSLSMAAETLQQPNPNNPKISAYYQTRAAHHGVVTSDWLAQAQAAVGPSPDAAVTENSLSKTVDSGKTFSVIDEFNNWRKQPDLAEAVAAIRALASVIRSSEATTMMELEIELKKASDSLKSWDTTSISLTAGCDLFMRYVTRTSALEYEDFNSAKSRLLERAEKFGEISYKARKIIAMLGQDFIFDGCTILVHGFSRVVLELLKTAAQNRKVFRVLCTEGRPDRSGLRFSNELAKVDVPVKLLIDSAVAYSMDEVDMIFVGADGVVESGGIINMMGTYQIALVAKSMNRPVYVAAESYKFARLYPLDQKDMVPALRPIDFGVPIPSKVEVETSARDYTPPQYLTLLGMVSSETKPNSSAKIKLIDGRNLAYKERGVPKDKSNYRIIMVHGFDSSKERDFLAPKELMNKMGIYIVQFDRAGYGESDPNPKRSLRSEASDIEELADHLELGSKFYIIGFSMGSYPTWSCIKHISHRLAGVAFVVPIVNYQWPSLPDCLTKDDERKRWYKRMTLVARFAPRLLHWWLIRKSSVSSSVDNSKPTYFTAKDLELLKNAPGFQFLTSEKLKSRSVFNNLCSDFLVAFSKWDFDPLMLSNPFPENGQNFVHIWHGCEDKFINLKLQRHVSERLPWIQYHEVPDGGHLLIYDTIVCEAILKSLLLGEDTPLYTPNFT